MRTVAAATERVEKTTQAILTQLGKLAKMDAQIAEGVAGFHAEAFFNLIKILQDAAKELPRRKDGTAFVDIEIETAQAVAGHPVEARDCDASDNSSGAGAEVAAAR